VAGPGNILIRVGAEAGQAVAELAKVNRSLGDTMTTQEKMHAGLKKAAIPAAAALTAIGVAGVSAAKAAIEDAAAAEHLAGQLKRTTGATDAQVKASEDYIAALTKTTGVADDDLRPALGKLAAASHSVAKGQKLLGIAVDVSAQSGEDLATVSDAIAKGYLGQTRAIGRLVPGIDKATLASKDMTKITAELAALTGGAAAEHADTAAGRFQVLSTRMSELKETLGYDLIPLIEAFLPLLEKAATFAENNTTAIKVLVGVVAGLSAAVLAANAAIKVYQALSIAVKVATAAWTAAQWLLNAALNANPIGLVVVALAALAAGLVVAYKHSETFRAIVQGALSGVASAAAAVDRAFDALLASARAAFNWIVANWRLGLFAFGPIGAALYVLVDNFGTVRAAATWAANVVDAAWTVARFGFGPIIAAVNAIAAAFRRIVDYSTAAIAAVRELIGWLGKLHVPKISLPHIPGTRAGSPLYYYPVGARARAGGAGSYALAPAAGGVTVNVYGAVDPEGTARAIRRLLTAHDRRQGRLP